MAEEIDQLPAEAPPAMSTETSEDEGSPLEPQGPPRLPPASGVLIQGSKANGLVRPVAFKPVLGFHSPAISEESGVAELEVLLRDRDAEIAYLRETLEHNEQVIFRVHADKERAWHQKLARLRVQLESRIAQSTQENSKLQTTLADKDQKIESLQKQLSDLETQMEWNISQKSGEIALLRAQLKESQPVESLRAQLKDLRISVDDKDAKITELKERLKQEVALRQCLEKGMEDLSSQWEESADHLEDKNRVLIQQKQELESLRAELATARQDARQARQRFEEDRLRWQEEKTKVIQYQKHLQQNYVHMYHKNLYLRTEMEHLALSKDPHCGESHC